MRKEGNVMAHLNEEDYRELIDYIIEKLRIFEADDVIRQIQGLEKVSVLEKAEPLVDMPGEQATQNAAKHLHDQLKIEYFEKITEDRTLSDVFPRPNKKPDKKLVKEAVSEYRLRPMTFRERYHSSIDILESYLITVPDIVEATRRGLKLHSDEHIYWAAEPSHSSMADNLDAEQLVRQAEPQNREKMKELVTALRETY